MKKYISLVLAIALIISVFTACGNQSNKAVNSDKKQVIGDKNSAIDKDLAPNSKYKIKDLGITDEELSLNTLDFEITDQKAPTNFFRPEYTNVTNQIDNAKFKTLKNGIDVSLEDLNEAVRTSKLLNKFYDITVYEEECSTTASKYVNGKYSPNICARKGFKLIPKKDIKDNYAYSSEGLIYLEKNNFDSLGYNALMFDFGSLPLSLEVQKELYSIMEQTIGGPLTTYALKAQDPECDERWAESKNDKSAYLSDLSDTLSFFTQVNIENDENMDTNFQIKRFVDFEGFDEDCLHHIIIEFRVHTDIEFVKIDTSRFGHFYNQQAEHPTKDELDCSLYFSNLKKIDTNKPETYFSDYFNLIMPTFGPFNSTMESTEYTKWVFSDGETHEKIYVKGASDASYKRCDDDQGNLCSPNVSILIEQVTAPDGAIKDSSFSINGETMGVSTPTDPHYKDPLLDSEKELCIKAIKYYFPNFDTSALQKIENTEQALCDLEINKHKYDCKVSIEATTPHRHKSYNLHSFSFDDVLWEIVKAGSWKVEGKLIKNTEGEINA